MGLKKEETLGRRKDHLSFGAMNQVPGSSFGDNIAWGPLLLDCLAENLLESICWNTGVVDASFSVCSQVTLVFLAILLGLL